MATDSALRNSKASPIPARTQLRMIMFLLIVQTYLILLIFEMLRPTRRAQAAQAVTGSKNNAVQ